MVNPARLYPLWSANNRAKALTLMVRVFLFKLSSLGGGTRFVVEVPT